MRSWVVFSIHNYPFQENTWNWPLELSVFTDIDAIGRAALVGLDSNLQVGSVVITEASTPAIRRSNNRATWRPKVLLHRYNISFFMTELDVSLLEHDTEIQGVFGSNPCEDSHGDAIRCQFTSPHLCPTGTYTNLCTCKVDFNLYYVIDNSG